MTGQQIYENFANAPGTDGLAGAMRILDEVRGEYERLQEDIISGAGDLEQHWQGDASSAAQRGAGPLAITHAQSGDEMRYADGLFDQQITSFNDTKNAVQPVPPVPPMPQPSWIGSPPAGMLNHYLSTQAANSAAAANVAQMTTWTGTSNDNAARMPATYGTIDPGAIGITQASSAGKPGAVKGFDGYSGAPPKPRTGGPFRGSEPGGGPASPPPGPGESTVDSPKHPAPVEKGEDQTTRPVEDRTTPNPIRNPATDVPRPPISGPPGGGNPNWFPPVTGPGGPGRTSGPGSGPGAGRLNGPGAGRIGGPGTAGPGTGGGTGGRPGGGPGSGAGLTGARGLTESGMRGLAGGAGRGGAGGMAPGAAGQRGKGGEDEEHQRKYVLDDDSAFLPSEKGEKIVDPTTGMSPTPPVIGK